jgi:hypothetical protein
VSDRLFALSQHLANWSLMELAPNSELSANPSSTGLCQLLAHSSYSKNNNMLAHIQLPIMDG